MRIDSLLITGSNGFVGTSFLDYLASLPDSSKPKEIFLVNRTESRHPILLSRSSRFKVIDIKQDLRNKWSFDFNVTHVLNLAADGSASAYSVESSQNFIQICMNLIDWSTKVKPKSLVHASSGACFYSNLTDSLWSEKKAFIESRLFGEKAIFSAGKSVGMKIVNARLFTFLGPRMLKNMQYAAPSFLHEACKFGVINVTGNKNTVRSYMHERTMASKIYECLTKNNLQGNLSIGSYEAVTIMDLANCISSLTGAKIIYNNSNRKRTEYLPKSKPVSKGSETLNGPKWYSIIEECVAMLRAKQNERKK